MKLEFLMNCWHDRGVLENTRVWGLCDGDYVYGLADDKYAGLVETIVFPWY